MRPFEFLSADDEAAAIAAAARSSTASVRFVGGGTTLVDLMKLEVERPDVVVDVSRLPLSRIERLADGGLHIGATARNADVAHHPLVQQGYPVLSQAILAGASAQVRNMATTAGNLLQRTRCMYFRDVTSPCNKREPGSGCAALEGQHRSLAVLGTSEHCIATNPSDMAVAMAALEATIEVRGPAGARRIAIDDFYLLPNDTPQRETVLAPGDLITHVTLPPPQPDARSLYLKLRDRASFEFALASAAAIVNVADGTFTRARVALGGVGTRPWRAREAELELIGRPVTEATLRAAADAALRDARPRALNAFKVELARRCLVHTLRVASSGGAP